MMTMIKKFTLLCIPALLVVMATAEEDILELTMYGDDKAKIPRKVVPDKPVGEIFYTYRECSKQGIRKHNATHIFLPFETMLTAEYAKIRNDDKNWEAGITKQIWTPQGYQSLFKTATNKPIVVAVEKTHGLLMGGRKIETAPKTPTNRDPEIDKKAREKVVFRSRLLIKLALLAKAAPLSFSAMVDVNHDAILGDFETKDKAFSLPDVARVRKMTKDVQEKVAGGGKPLKTNNECFHFTDDKHIGLKHDGMFYPLERTNVAYKGEAEQMPQRHLGMNTGLTKFVFNEKTDTLEVQFLVSSRGYLSLTLDGIVESASGFAVSPVDGKPETKLAKPGGRPKMPEVGTFRYYAMQGMRALIANYPEDTKIMDEDHDKICPESYEGKVNGFMKRFNTKAFFEQLDKAGISNSIGILDDAINLLQAWGQTGRCATGYMKGAVPGAFGLNFANAVGVLTHAAMEIPYKVAFKTLARQDWNVLTIQSRDKQLKEEESKSYLAKLGEPCLGDMDCASGECYESFMGEDTCECNSGQYRSGHNGCKPDEECIDKSWGSNYCLPKKRKAEGDSCKEDKECQSLHCDEGWFGWGDGECGAGRRLRESENHN